MGFLGIFYDHYIAWLAEALTRESQQKNMNCTMEREDQTPHEPVQPALHPGGGPVTMPKQTALTPVQSGTQPTLLVEFDFKYATMHQSVTAMRSSQIHVVDLLCFAVEQHTYRIKYYVLRKNVVGMSLRLLQCREKHVQLAAIRFATTCIRRNEQFYNR